MKSLLGVMTPAARQFLTTLTIPGDLKMRSLTCPMHAYQSGKLALPENVRRLMNVMAFWKKCDIMWKLKIRSYKECPHFQYKSGCWSEFDREFNESDIKLEDVFANSEVNSDCS